jgi:hypothetical protein
MQRDHNIDQLQQKRPEIGKCEEKVMKTFDENFDT